jgi:hypothetical protein
MVCDGCWRSPPRNGHDQTRLVSAILSLQSKRFTDESVREEFTAAANRIRNLALVQHGSDRLSVLLEIS